MSRIAAPLAVLLIGLAITCGLWVWTDDNCQKRGGHTELVWGGRGGWVCEGAER